MKNTYKVNISGKEVTLPIIKIGDDLSIAFFNLHGNVELTEFCALHLSKLLTDCDIIITAESKGLQLAHCIARNLNHPYYIAARKSKKLYMSGGIKVEVKSITTGKIQNLYISAEDAEKLNGKKVGIVDDVISTGASIAALERLATLAGGTVCKKAAVLAEGDAMDRGDICFLSTIPLF